MEAPLEELRGCCELREWTANRRRHLHNLEQILWLLLRGLKYGVIAKTSLSRHDSLGKSELGKMLLMRIT